MRGTEGGLSFKSDFKVVKRRENYFFTRWAMPIQLFPFRPQDPRPAERGQEDGQLQSDDRRGRRAQPTRDDRGRRLAHGPRRGARIFPCRLRGGGRSLLVEKAGE